MGSVYRAYFTALVLSVVFALVPAHGEIKFSGSPSLNTDDNIFKVSHSAILPSSYHRSDIFYNLEAGTQVNASITDWKAEIDASASKTWFERNSDLDTFGYRLIAKVDHEARNISIDARASQSRQLSSFADIRTSGKNVQTSTLASSRIDYRLIDRFSLVAGVNYQRSSNTSSAQSDYDQLGELIGVSYKSGIGNTIALEVRHRHATGLATSEPQSVIDQRLPLNFSENRFGLALKYSITDFVIVNGDGGYLVRHDHVIAGSDFNGVTGRINLRLVPRDTIRIDATVSRQLELQNLLQIDAVRVTSSSLAAETDITATTLGRFTATLERRNYRDPGDDEVTGTEKQRINRYELEAEQSIGAHLTLSLRLRHETRNSSVALSDFHSNGAVLALRVLN